MVFGLQPVYFRGEKFNIHKGETTQELIAVVVVLFSFK